MNRYIAVLTGDIIRSTDLSAEELSRVMAVLKQAAGEIAEWQNEDTLFTRFSGDGWKLVLANTMFVLRATMYLRACLRREGKMYSTRIVAGIGEGGTDSHDLNEASGPVFVETGRALEDMPSRHELLFASCDFKMKAIFELADSMSRRWTVGQARSIVLMLGPFSPTHKHVAYEIGIKRQSVSDALESSHYWALESALANIEGQRQSKIDPGRQLKNDPPRGAEQAASAPNMSIGRSLVSQ